MMTSSNGNIFRVTGHFCGELTGHRWIPHKGKWREALMFSLIHARINGWVHNNEAGDLRRNRDHYYVTVMRMQHCSDWGGTFTFVCTKDTPSATLIAEIWGIYQYLGETWPCYYGIVLYRVIIRTMRIGIIQSDDSVKWKYTVILSQNDTMICTDLNLFCIIATLKRVWQSW